MAKNQTLENLDENPIVEVPETENQENEEITDKPVQTLPSTDGVFVMEAPDVNKPSTLEGTTTDNFAVYAAAASYTKDPLAYEGTEWKNMEQGGTPLNATNLNNIEDGVKKLVERSNEQDAQIAAVTSAWDSAGMDIKSLITMNDGWSLGSAYYYSFGKLHWITMSLSKTTAINPNESYNPCSVNVSLLPSYNVLFGNDNVTGQIVASGNVWVAGLRYVGAGASNGLVSTIFFKEQLSASNNGNGIGFGMSLVEAGTINERIVIYLNKEKTTWLVIYLNSEAKIRLGIYVTASSSWQWIIYS